MPTNLVKSKQDEADWAEARRIVDKQYPDKSPDDKDKSYWKLTTSIYENIKKNRGKKQMQKQASVGELLAGQLRLRKQADGNAPRSGVVGRIGDKLTDWLGWKKRPRGWSNPPKRTPGYRPGNSRVVPLNEMNAGGRVVPLNEITAGGHVDTLEYRGPGFVKRGGRWVQDPEWAPLPSPRQPLPAPTPRPFPIPRGIRGPWERPENPPDDPLNNERIRRLVEGDNAPNGGRWGERPINDSEIPLPADDPGGAPAPNNRPSNTPPANPPKMTEEELNRIMRELQRGNGRPRYYDPGWNNEPGWYERMRWPRLPEVERPYNEWEQPSNEWEWPYDRWGRPRGEWGRIYDKWFWPKGQYYHRGRGRNGEIDPRGINIQPDAWYQGRTLPPMSVRDMQY